MIILHRRFKVEFYFKLVLVRQDCKKSLNTSDFDSFSVLLGTRIIRKQAGLSALHFNWERGKRGAGGRGAPLHQAAFGHLLTAMKALSTSGAGAAQQFRSRFQAAAPHGRRSPIPAFFPL